MFNKKSKGFTIIELLVVIAIIAVLAAIVLVNVTQYITKGKDAAARGNLATILTNGAVYYDSMSSYSNFNTTGSYTNVTAALTTAGYATTFTTSTTSFCASIALKTAPNNNYCVDSTGNKKEGGGVCAAGLCP